MNKIASVNWAFVCEYGSIYLRRHCEISIAMQVPWPKLSDVSVLRSVVAGINIWVDFRWEEESWKMSRKNVKYSGMCDLCLSCMASLPERLVIEEVANVLTGKSVTW